MLGARTSPSAMSAQRELFGVRQSAQPTNENSPPIHRWERKQEGIEVRETDG